jgi:hypothetical protein
MKDYQAELQHFHRDVEYYQAHWEQLLDQYPEQWVAIFDEQVVGADPDAYRLLANLRERGIPTEKALVKYVTAKDDILILPG